MLLGLEEKDFAVPSNNDVFIPRGIAKFLFSGRDNLVDFEASNQIYTQIRDILSTRAHEGKLTANEIVVAKSIINALGHNTSTTNINSHSSHILNTNTLVLL